jgi:hypothetical protein
MELVHLGTDDAGCVIDLDKLLSVRFYPKGDRVAHIQIVITLGEGKTQSIELYSDVAEAAWKQLRDRAKGSDSLAA